MTFDNYNLENFIQLLVSPALRIYWGQIITAFLSPIAILIISLIFTVTVLNILKSLIIYKKVRL